MGVHFDRALLLFERSRYEQAEGELRRELAERPDHALTHSMIGLCRHHRNDLPGALDWAERAIGLSPCEAYTHYALAIILGRLKRPDAAGKAIREAIRLDPTQAVYFFQWACMESDRGRNRQALDAADRGLAVDARHVGCASIRALSLARLRRRREAEAAITAAIALEPENDFVHAAEGWRRTAQGDGAGARNHFREALRINPMNRWARTGLEFYTSNDLNLAIVGILLFVVMLFGIETRRNLGKSSVLERAVARFSRDTGIDSTLVLAGGAWLLLLAAVLFYAKRRSVRAR